MEHSNNKNSMESADLLNNPSNYNPGEGQTESADEGLSNTTQNQIYR